MPWLEYNEGRTDYTLRPSPRLFASHLTPALLPRGLKDKKAKVSVHDKQYWAREKAQTQTKRND